MSNLPMVIPVEPNQPLDLRRGWATISRSAWIIVVCVGLAVAAGVVAARRVEPLYQAETTVRIDEPRPTGMTNAYFGPDYQQLLTGVELVIWLDSQSEEMTTGPTLESRVATALSQPATVTRFGGLSLGESTHLVDEVTPVARMIEREPDRLQHSARAFLLRDRGRLTLPIWVDHVGSAKTRYATGDLVDWPPHQPPEVDSLPRILPEYAS